MGPLRIRGLVLILHTLEIPGGTITLRNARSGTRREVALAPFTLGRTQITQAQWHKVMEHSGTPPTAVGLPQHGLTWFQAVDFCNAASVQDGFTPAYEICGRSVEWDVAAQGYRLPTEAEWEWAARGGTLSAVYGELAQIAWTALDAVDGPQPVAGKKPNNYGLFDMIGNAWEWCWDYADTARYGEYRSLRGAGWDDPPWSPRASVRRGSAPDAVLEDVGFRVARGPVGALGSCLAQGWSAAADKERAAITGPRPVGWTPLKSL
ncbi:formylglycine-generating enzyme family protein [Arthrobacter psychrochitiniphilus]|uniref:formylglycine-generating enzyme family protein n=1 Tax=Arthrobacter psychrochitiniphilus TaxID=291045 RepID=UPI0017EF90E4|nr:SUMF1/EgtB/PvdO family nonheme iron enzyme [Arthrobacter psychrochitiniphilus]NYG15838.1 formylglycine-generating enzyme required for sulfatase activity [Arthrobacter psychrochitiniphilus]